VQYLTSQERQQADAWAAEQRRVVEQAAQAEEARKKNIQVFVQMLLGLGPDCIKVAGSNHDAELAEARGLAANRWSALLDLEAQVQREEQNLALRPKKRPPAPGDDLLADEVIKRQEEAFAAQTAGRRDQIVLLKQQAKAQRAELESFIVRRVMASPGSKPAPKSKPAPAPAPKQVPWPSKRPKSK
jgi:hypothetical protein